MKLEIRHIGTYYGKPSTIIELTVSSNGTSITENVSSLNGRVNEDLILSLRQIADELEEQNIKCNDKLK